MKKAIHRILPLLLALTLMPAAACAVNITLNPVDAGGINSAISTVAGNSDTNNTITLNAGTYNKETDKESRITFSAKNITIIGYGAPGSVIIDAQNDRRIFEITGNSSVTFDNLTMKSGVNATGGGAGSAGTPTLYGGAIDIRGGGAITITGCAFTGNDSSGSGGGAAYIGRASTVAITDSTFSGNTVTGSGGALHNDDGTVAITDCAFTGNTAGGNGGAVYNNSGTVNITGSAFSNNTATGSGGAIYNNTGTVNITDSTITGGIYNNTGGTLTVNYGSSVDAIENHGTAKFEVLFGVTGLGGSLTATAGNSPVADGDFVESGSQMTFSAVPGSGYRVKQWTVKQWTDGNAPATSTGGNYSIAGLSSPYKVTVEFEQTGNDITAFSIGGVNGVINGTNITVTLPYGTDVTSLTPTVVHTGVSISPDGTAQDFTSPVTYTVTAADGSTKDYVVTVNVAANNAKDITAFSIGGVNGVINGTNITVNMPYGTNQANLTPTFTHTGASVSPASGVAQDFTNPVTYTVTAQDGSMQVYTVTVRIRAASSLLPKTGDGFPLYELLALLGVCLAALGLAVALDARRKPRA